MTKIKMILKQLGLTDWILALTGLFVVAIGILDFGGWLQLSVERLLQIAIIGLGLLTAAMVIQANRQKTSLIELGIDLEKSVRGHFTVTKFDKIELGVDYIANRVRTVKRSIDHASLSSPVPRWPSSISRFEKAIREVALSNQIKIRYIANFSDEARLKRVYNILKNPSVNRYFVTYFSPDKFAHPLNFLIFDDEEIILSVPGSGEEDVFLAIKNEDIISAFSHYFNLLWHMATPFDRATVMGATTNK